MVNSAFVKCAPSRLWTFQDRKDSEGPPRSNVLSKTRPTCSSYPASIHSILPLDQYGRFTYNRYVSSGKLDTMMHIYEHGFLRKSQALRVAVQRGLHAPQEVL